jgi:xanthine dehydrogenase small subunit
MPPALIAAGATLALRKGAACRTLPLEAYFLAYGKPGPTGLASSSRR